MKVMKNLKVMNLTNCLCLERTPDFSAHSKLECLSLVDCKKLVEIDVSICQLKSLVFLEIKYCMKLQRLPDELGRGLASLKYLSLVYCTSLKRLPKTIGNLEWGSHIEELPGSFRNLKSLIKLNISNTLLKELPNSIGLMENLEVVTVRARNRSKIPDAFWTLEKLKVIGIGTEGGFDVEIGNHIYKNRSLRILRLLNGRIYVVPRLPESLIILKLSKLYTDTFPDFSNLTNLKELELEFVQCDFDGESHGESDGPMEEDPMPPRIENLSKLESLSLTSPYVTTLPTDSRSLLPRLKSLQLWCPNLCCLPSLPSSLLKLGLYNCKSCCSMEDLSNLKTLSDLEIVDSAISEIRGLDHLENLNHFWCDTLQQVEILPNLSNLNKLGDLMVSNCGNLVEIQGDFPPSLESFAILECGSLQKLPDLSSLKGLERVQIKGCRKLNVVVLSNLNTLSDLKIIDSAISEIRGLDCLENLNCFEFGTLQQVEILPDLSNLNKLRKFMVFKCENLVEIQGDFPQSLELFLFWQCRSLKKLPDLSSLKGLKRVHILDCRKLNAEAIYSLCSEKGVEYEGDGRLWEQMTKYGFEFEVTREKTSG